MDDPYRRYAAPPTERASNSRPNFPGYIPSEPSMLTRSSIDYPGSSSEYIPRDILPPGRGVYTVDGSEPVSVSGLLPAPLGIRGYEYPIEDPTLLGPIHNSDLPVAAVTESNILFVDGLPTDCSRREVGHLFRPFIGFGEIKVVHKEPRRSGDKARVLCFVEFADAKCALTAMEALQGYKFDDKKANSPKLKIHFAHFPFTLPSDHNDQRLGGLQK